MSNPDIIVIGAGISGLTYAWKAARAGRKVLILERRQRIGGCIYSYRFDDGYWYELGAHTVYNSYSELLQIAEETGLADRLVQRGPARVHFGLLKNGSIDWLTPPKILLRLNWLETILHAPFGFLRSKRNRSLEQHYSGFLGPRNFRRILSPFFAAVPSQCADGFPAEGPGSLFKKRERRKEFPRSFGFPGGLQAVCDAIVTNPNIEVRTGVTVSGLSPVPEGFEVRTEQGESIHAPAVAVAATHQVAASILQDSYKDLSDAIRHIETASLESLGTRIHRDKCSLPECAFIVPVDDIFFSAVSRDPFPDPVWRGFAFHFRPGVEYEQKVDRICSLLNVSPSDLDVLAGQNLTLPAPRVHHAAIVADIDRNLENTGIALMGNYFMGLAIEDCIARATSEWQRLNS
ncbi:MAG: FAD-dependent oxidoreductase [Acidobacteria bacterium]|nr:FAD-dependent oxidoreductase [Acidobacteriota bacterium]